MSEVCKSQLEINEAEVSLEKIEEYVERIENIYVGLESILNEDPDFNNDLSAMAVETYLEPTGMDVELSMEGIKDALTKTIKTVKKAIIKMIEAVKLFFSKLFGGWKAMSKRLDALKKQADLVTDNSPELKPIEHASLLKLAIGSKLDKETILSGIDLLTLAYGSLGKAKLASIEGFKKTLHFYKDINEEKMEHKLDFSNILSGKIGKAIDAYNAEIKKLDLQLDEATEGSIGKDLLGNHRLFVTENLIAIPSWATGTLGPVNLRIAQIISAEKLARLSGKRYIVMEPNEVKMDAFNLTEIKEMIVSLDKMVKVGLDQDKINKKFDEVHKEAIAYMDNAEKEAKSKLKKESVGLPKDISTIKRLLSVSTGKSDAIVFAACRAGITAIELSLTQYGTELATFSKPKYALPSPA